MCIYPTCSKHPGICIFQECCASYPMCQHRDALATWIQEEARRWDILASHIRVETKPIVAPEHK